MRRRLMVWTILAAFLTTMSLPAAVAAQQQNPNQNRTRTEFAFSSMT